MNEVRNIIVGFELGEKASQLCYYDRRTGDAVSLSMKVGTGQYAFPNCVSKRPGEDEWHFGLEVEYFVEKQNEVYLDNIYRACAAGRTVSLDAEEWDAGELLGRFIGYALRILGVPDPVKSISGLMITVPALTRPLVENVRKACAYLGFSRNRCFLQSYEESFYYHTLYQRPELWSRQVALFRFDGDLVSFSQLEMDHKTRPVQVRVARGRQVKLSSDPGRRDLDFCQLIQESMGTQIFSSVYLVGEGFDQEWAVRSVPLLCRNQRHVFYGSNLFVKGACFGAREKVEDRNLKGYLYCGNDLVRKNVGMDMLISGSPAYYSLIGAGVNWYEAVGDCEILLDGTRELVFTVSDMEGKQKEKYSMQLPGLPERPPKATRLHIHLEFESDKRCRIHVTDLGLGEMYPASGMEWEETILSDRS